MGKVESMGNGGRLKLVTISKEMESLMQLLILRLVKQKLIDTLSLCG